MSFTQRNSNCGCMPQRIVPRNNCEMRTIRQFDPCEDYETVCGVEERCNSNNMMGPINNYGFDYYQKHAPATRVIQPKNGKYYTICSNC